MPYPELLFALVLLFAFPLSSEAEETEELPQLVRPPDSLGWTEDDYASIGRAGNVTGFLGIEPQLVKLNRTSFGQNVGYFVAGTMLTAAVFANFDVGALIPGPFNSNRRKSGSISAAESRADDLDQCNCRDYCEGLLNENHFQKR